MDSTLSLNALRSAGEMVSLLAITGMRFVLLPISFIATMSRVFRLRHMKGELKYKGRDNLAGILREARQEGWWAYE